MQRSTTYRIVELSSHIRKKRLTADSIVEAARGTAEECMRAGSCVKVPACIIEQGPKAVGGVVAALGIGRQ